MSLIIIIIVKSELKFRLDPDYKPAPLIPLLAFHIMVNVIVNSLTRVWSKYDVIQIY